MAFIEQYGEALFFSLTILSGFILLFMSILWTRIDKEKNILKKMTGRKYNAKKGVVDELIHSTPFLQRYEDKNKLKYAIIEDKYPARRITKFSLLTSVIVFVFGLGIRNIIVTIAGTYFGFFIPLIFVDMAAKSKRGKVQDQLGTAIKFFTSEFTTSRSVVVAMQRIIGKLPNPIRYEFERLTREFNSGGSPEQALANFALRVNNKYAYIFSRLLTAYFNKGTEFGPHLVQLTEDIMDEQLSMSEGKAELAMVRVTNMILNGAVFISIFIIFFIVPDRSVTFRESVSGQILVTVAVALSVASLTIGLKLEG